MQHLYRSSSRVCPLDRGLHETLWLFRLLRLIGRKTLSHHIDMVGTYSSSTSLFARMLLYEQSKSYSIMQDYNTTLELL